MHVEGVPFARDGARCTRDFDNLVCWLASKTAKTASCRLSRIDWETIGRMIERVDSELIDSDRLNNLFEISLDEVAWRKGHRYLTLIANHRTGRVVWGCEGKGQAAADRFFAELDPEPPRRRPRRPNQPHDPSMPRRHTSRQSPRSWCRSAPARPSRPTRASRRRGLPRAASSTRQSSRAAHD